MINFKEKLFGLIRNSERKGFSEYTNINIWRTKNPKLVIAHKNCRKKIVFFYISKKHIRSKFNKLC